MEFRIASPGAIGAASSNGYKMVHDLQDKYKIKASDRSADFAAVAVMMPQEFVRLKPGVRVKLIRVVDNRPRSQVRQDTKRNQEIKANGYLVLSGEHSGKKLFIPGGYLQTLNVHIGESGFVYASNSSDSIAGAFDVEHLLTFYEADLKGDYGTIKRLKRDGRIVAIPRGMACVGKDVSGELVQVRLTSGPKRGKLLWVPSVYTSIDAPLPKPRQKR
ncbi:MAG: hypothetical protein WAO58_02805 [Fimbriimonadaceae bacterium]